MAQTWRELEFKVGAEIGVAEGEHAEILCKENPDLKLYCIDAWQHYHGYTDYLSAKLAAFHDKAIARLASYNCELIQKFSADAVKDFADASLDFVYIDGAHDFLNVATDLCLWTPKVRLGGVVYGHDWKRARGFSPLSQGGYMNHVKDVVPGYVYAYQIRPWFILGEKGHNDGRYREGTQSWMFVRGA
jgi:hypothetical protein